VYILASDLDTRRGGDRLHGTARRPRGSCLRVGGRRLTISPITAPGKSHRRAHIGFPTSSRDSCTQPDIVCLWVGRSPSERIARTAGPAAWSIGIKRTRQHLLSCWIRDVHRKQDSDKRLKREGIHSRSCWRKPEKSDLLRTATPESRDRIGGLSVNSHCACEGIVGIERRNTQSPQITVRVDFPAS
jgi:hypothetical protein